MPPAEDPAAPPDASVNRHRQHKLIVCLFGSFTTIVAMTMMLPFLPLDVEELGARGHAGIVQWSGIAYSASFFTAGGHCVWMNRGRP